MAAAVENPPIPSNENSVPGAESKDTADMNGDSVTVFHDPENFTIKHPLMHEWTLWFTKPASGKVPSPPICLWLYADLSRWTTGTTC